MKRIALKALTSQETEIKRFKDLDGEGLVSIVLSTSIVDGNTLIFYGVNVDGYLVFTKTFTRIKDVYKTSTPRRADFLKYYVS